MSANIFNDVYNTMSSGVSAARGATTALVKEGPGLVFVYIAAAALVAVIVIQLLAIKIDWSALDPRPKRSIVMADALTFMTPSKQYTNLSVPATTPELYGFKDDSYSIQFDSQLLDSRNYTANTSIYRHILHRGSNELETSTVAGQVLSRCVAVNTSALPPEGLPARMNPGIFLDPVKNDLLVFVDTIQGAQPYRESVRIADIPLHTPFRMEIVLNGRVLEVYLNCRLEVTKVLAGTPKVVENQWYGIAGAASAQAQVQNLLLWKRPLGVEDVKALCEKPKLPTFASVRPICDMANTPASTPPAGAGTIELGNGVTAQVCRS